MPSLFYLQIPEAIAKKSICTTAILYDSQRYLYTPVYCPLFYIDYVLNMENTSADINKEENAVVRKLTIVSILGNIVLTVFKMFAGIVGHSGAMVSDAIHSLSDVLTTFIAAWGVKIAQAPADKEHPYGHERLECVASLVLGLILGATGLAVGKAGIEDIFCQDDKTPTIPTAVALVAAAFSIVLKEVMYWYTRYHAKRINSAAFMADAWHHRSDALSSIGSLIGIGGAMMGYPIMDSIASVVICLFILKVTYDILKDALQKMLDTSCDAEYEQSLKDFISAYPEVLSIDTLRTRQFGNRVYIDLEIEMDGEKSLRETHDAAEKIHDDVEAAFPTVKHIMIHVNPSNSVQETSSHTDTRVC